MTTLDFSPLYRTTVGFDRLANLLANSTRPDQGNGYPPYNIAALDENHYRITMAVAGFAREDIEIVSAQNTLTVSGGRTEDEDNDDVRFLHRGIANRNFERRFNLADHVRVRSATMENGLLHIELERELPEAMKPRTIAIEAPRAALEGQQQEAEAA